MEYYQISLEIIKTHFLLVGHVLYLGHSRIPASVSLLHTLQYVCFQVHADFISNFKLARNATLGHNIRKFSWSLK